MQMSSGLWRRSLGAALIGLTVAARLSAQASLPGVSAEMETRPML